MLAFQTYGLNALPSAGAFSPTSGTGMGTDYLTLNFRSHPNDQNKMELRSKMGAADTDLEAGSLEGWFAFDAIFAYDADAETLTYTFKRSGFLDQTVTRTDFDMADRFSGDFAYFGFAGTTGAEAENHDVRTVTINAVPEPTTGALLALTGLALAAVRRMKRRNKA